MAAGTLYTYPENWRAFKAQIAAQYSGARLKVASAPPAFTFGQTNRSPAFLGNFPLGKVPAFEADDGFCLFESNAIAYYLSNDVLRGSSPQASAQVLQWVSFADAEIIPPASTWVFPTLGIMQYNKQVSSRECVSAPHFLPDASRLSSGMFQRLDKLRKHAFASVILFGTNNDSSISGIWVFRGQDLAFTLSEDWQVDYESYSWRKLDVDSDECKTMVKEYFAWEGDFKHVGKAFNQGKIFK
uniref:Eukaryotic translation elongation factor 1 gamma n=1 Tax=Scleropages formosus TaxID=113540 RepID=A0A8C9WU11_SCLFO